MLCSILISNFNKSKYIKRCLNSLYSQSYKNIEIIFSDNNSNDNSLEIASNYQNINIIQTQRISNFPAINQIDVINQAFQRSKGEFIFLLDSDDFFEKTKVEKVLNFHKKYKSDFICDIPNLFFNKKEIYKFKTKSYFSFLRTWPIILPTSTISFTKDFFKDFQKYLLANDFNKLEIDFRLNVFAFIENKQNFLLDDSLTFYNQTQDGIMSNYKKFDKKWWKKRMQAHQYFQKISDKKNFNYKKNIDYYFTRLINRFY